MQNQFFRCRAIFLFLLLSALCAISARSGPQLQVGVNGTNLVLAWPTNAVGFRAQSRAGLAGAEIWSDVNASPAVTNALRQLAVPLAGGQQFFRLVKNSGTNPAVAALTVSTNQLPFGSTATLQFDIIEPDVDLAALELTWTNVLGSFSNLISAKSIGLTGASIHAQLPIRPDKLPLGTTYFKLRLVDHLGLYSAPVFFQIAIVGENGPGTAPQLLSVVPEATEWQQSYDINWQLKPGFILNWSDAQSDVERIRATLLLPTGETNIQELIAARAGFNGAGGTNTLRPFILTYADSSGTYLATFQLIDRTGRVSAEQSAQFDLDYSAPPPLQITSFSPSSGLPGSMVQLFASGLAGLGTNLQVTLAGVPCTFTNQSSYLSLLVPTGAVTGQFKIVTAAQVTSSPADFTVPPVITLTSDRDEAAPGEPVQFFTSVRGATDVSLTFSVNGFINGNATVGLISANGLYHLPLLPPTNVTIVAALSAQPSITATSMVRVLPQASVGGMSWISATRGGSVSAIQGNASLDVPPGALPTNAFLSIAVVNGTNVPSAPPGRRWLGGVRLGPDGTVFNQPVTVTLPLAETRPPGAILALKYFIRATGTFVDEGLTATVVANGREAVGQILHFSEVGVDEPAMVAPISLPQITTVQAQTPFQEGLTVPVLITGQNLVPGLRIEVWRNGQPTGDVVTANAIFETNRLGLLVSIATLPDLNFGNSRNYELRLVNGANQFASANLLVQGLNELIVPPGGQTNLPGTAQVFSEVEIGAGALVMAPAGLDWVVNGPVHIAGEINARGQVGQASLDEAPGVNPVHNDIAIGGDGGDPGRSGHDAYLELSPRGDFSYGQGGAPGEDVNFIGALLEALFNLASCVTGDFPSCGRLVANIVEIIGDSNAIAAGKAVGRPGLPGVRAGLAPATDNGGGGGGGGGGGELNFFDDGEGGGAGGQGGRGVSIVTRGDILVDGLVDTRGGDGGDGGENVITTFVGGGIPFEDTPSANRGGGGGGGAGGAGTLLARGGFQFGGTGSVNSQGGNPGNNLIRFRQVDVNTQVQTERLVRLVDAKYPFTPSGRTRTHGPVVQPRDLPDLVTERGLMHLQLPPESFQFGPPVMVTVRGEASNQVRQISFAPDQFGFRRANLLFFPGFNSIAVTDNRTPDHPALYRNVLYLAGADSDGDGLSDVDEAVIGSNPLLADSDNDGLNDAEEILLGLDPTTADTDGDLISDVDEINGGTNPRLRDTDGDGFWDGWELQAGSSPLNAQSTIALMPPGTLFAEVISSVNGRVLGIVNPATGKMAALGRVNSGLGFGLAFSLNGSVFASQGNRLIQLLLDRPADASGQLAFTNIGSFSTNGPPIYCYSLASSTYAGQLLGIESTVAGDSTGQLLSIDPLTGLATRIGTAQPQPLRALAVLGSGTTNEMLFASTVQAGAADALLSFPSGPTNAAQLAGSLGWTNVYGLTPAAPHQLYASRTGTGTSELMLINTTNSTMTSQAVMTAPVFDLAHSPCPAPCLNGPVLSALPYPGKKFETADFNHDTHPDFAVTVTKAVGSDEYFGVAIMRGRGDGTFTNAASYFFLDARGSGDADIALADFNGDGRTDIIVMQPAVIVGFFSTLVRPAELMVLLADNQGGFQSPIIQAMDPGPSQRLSRITAADWSGDGLADLIFVNTGQGAYTFQGDGQGHFSNPVALLPNTSINAPLLADVNGDGRQDFVGVGYDFNVRLADGAGGFLTNQVTSGGGANLSVGDVDGDGDLDVVATDYGAVPTIHYNTGAGSFPTSATFNPRTFPFGVYARAALGDLTGDGRADVVVPSIGTSITAYVSGQAPGTLTHTLTEPPTAPFACGGTASNVLIADVNHDGRPDIITVTGNALSVLFGEESF